MTDAEQKRIEEFTLGPGVLYIGNKDMREDELEAYEYKFGDTDNGCTLEYEYKVRELFDIEGNAAAILRYGEMMRIRGKLCRVLSDSLRLVCDGGRVFGGTSGLAVLLVCPLPDGEALRLYAKGVIPKSLSFGAKMGGGLEFEFVYGKGTKYPRFCLKGEKYTGGAA